MGAFREVSLKTLFKKIITRRYVFFQILPVNQKKTLNAEKNFKKFLFCFLIFFFGDRKEKLFVRPADRNTGLTLVSEQSQKREPDRQVGSRIYFLHPHQHYNALTGI